MYTTIIGVGMLTIIKGTNRSYHLYQIPLYMSLFYLILLLCLSYITNPHGPIPKLKINRAPLAQAVK